MPLLTLLGQAATNVTIGDTSQLGALSSTGGLIVGETLGNTSQLGAIASTGGLQVTENIGATSQIDALSSTGGLIVGLTIGDTGQLAAFSSSGVLDAGDAVEAISYGGFLPELVERKLRKKDQDVLNDVIELVNKAEEIPLPQNIVKQVKQVEKKAEKTFKIQPIRIRNRELIETKERLIKVEGLVNRYVKELQEDEEEAIKALLEVI